ncbi:unnamed protein product [Camellia sinensis]
MYALLQSNWRNIFDETPITRRTDDALYSVRVVLAVDETETEKCSLRPPSLQCGFFFRPHFVAPRHSTVQLQKFINYKIEVRQTKNKFLAWLKKIFCKITELKMFVGSVPYLSQSLYDMLSSLKMLVLRRAKVIGHEALAKKFDLKMLRVLSGTFYEGAIGSMVKTWPNNLKVMVSSLGATTLCIMLKGFILMEHLKGELKDSSVIPSLVESSTFLDRCNLLNCNPNGSFGNMSIEELRAYVGSDKRKRMAQLFSEDGAPNQKMKPNAKRSLIVAVMCFVGFLQEEEMLFLS